jgi:hypothetical protein
MSARTASCACGQLSIEIDGDPVLTVACHCYDCQKRTGSSHQVSAWFPDSQIQQVSGSSSSYTRTGDLGGSAEFQFCPRCGTTLYWVASGTPNAHAIAVGCFADSGFPGPMIEIYDSRRHSWMSPIESATQFDTVPGGLPTDWSGGGSSDRR